MKNRLFAYILAAAMVLTVLPAVSLAVSDTVWYTSGVHTGTDADPLIIQTGDDLAGLAELVNAGNDFAGKVVKISGSVTVDISAYSNWNPIGTPAHPFRGTFDGNGISIDLMTINDTYAFTAAGGRCVGLFGDIGVGGVVKNIVLNAPNITVNHTSGGFSNTYSYVGGIAGVNEGTVLDCSVSNAVLNVSGNEIKVGGVVGTNSSDSGTSANVGGIMQNCSASVNIDAASSYRMVHAGGVAGGSTKAAAQIKDCSSSGSVTATGPQPVESYICTADVGGLVGYIDSTEISGCASSCEIAAEVGFNNVNAGGLIGSIILSTVNSSNSTGGVSGQGGESTTIYGIVSVGGFTGSFSNGSQIVGCYSTGDAHAQVKSTGLNGYAFSGGFAGYVKQFGPNTTIATSFATGDAASTALSNGYAFSGGFGGYLQATSINECFSSGDAQGTAATGGYASSGGFSGYVTDASVTDAYSIGSAAANCDNKERAGGFAGALSGTDTTFTQCYSIGLPSIAHSGANFACGSFAGAAGGTLTFTNCYYDSDTTGALSAAGSGTVSGITGATRAAMTSDSALSAGLSGLAVSGKWMKRANTAAEIYYPELSAFGSAGGSVQTASKTSVTVTLTSYTVTVENGSGSGNYSAGAVIDITADAAPSGKVFDKWTSSGGGSFGNAGSATTTYTVPAQNVTVTASYQSASGSSDSGTRPNIVVVETPDNLSGNVTVTPIGEAFDNSVEVRLTEDPVTEQQIQDALSGSGVSHQAALVYPLDISLYLRGTDTKVQPNEGTSVRITCPIPKELLEYKDKLAVVCIINGELQVLEANVVRKGNKWYVEFETEHFSPYAFVVDETGVLTEGLTLPAEQVVNPPKTGGEMGAGIELFFAAIGAAALLLKKRA